MLSAGRMKGVVLSLVIIFFSGCAALNTSLENHMQVFRPLTPGFKQSAKKIVVVSGMGNIFKGEKGGVARIGEKSFRYDIPVHDIDALIEDKISSHMRLSSGLNAQAGPDSRSLCGVDSRDLSHAGLIRQLTPLLDRLQQEGADAVVVVIPWTAAQKGVRLIRGYGFLQDFGAVDGTYAKQPNALFFCARINIVDVSTRTLVLDSYLKRVQPVNITQWHDRFEAYTPDERAYMVDFVLQTIDKELGEYLSRMNY